MTTPIQADYNSFLEGFSTQEMIYEVRRWLGQSPTDTNRYSNADVVSALNYGQTRFAKLTGCLTLPTVIILKANRQNYRLPFNTLRVLAGRYYTGSAKTSYYELNILDSMKRMQRLDSQFRGTTGTPQYLFPSYRAGNVQMIGVSPFTSTDGEAWTGSDYGVLTSATGFEFAGNITGTHKTGYAASAFLVDADGRDMTLQGALAGYPIFNVTDGSSGIITAISNADAVNDKVEATLSGGTNDFWSVDDSFQIPMGEYGTVLDGDNTVYTFTSWLGTIADISGNTGNLILDIARKPLSLSATLLDSICEIPATYQEAPIAFAVYWLGRSVYKGVVQAEKAKEGLEVFNRYVLEYLSPDELMEETETEIEDRSYEWLS